MTNGERSLAVFIDFENLALGFQGRRERFDIARVLERLVEKGKIVAKKAYADWSRFSGYTAPLHESAIELIEIPRRGQSGKNSADIRLVVDAMDLAYSKEHINTFVIVSGDSDFSPLVSKLKELGKHVLGLGMQESTSDLLRDNCDEFIYYEDLQHGHGLPSNVNPQLPEGKRKIFVLLTESLMALRRENKSVLWSSMIKDTIQRKKPSFNEAYYGYRTFSELLEDAEREGLLELETDQRSRTYVVTRFGAEMTGEATPDRPPQQGQGPSQGQPTRGGRSSRRRRGGARRGQQQGMPPQQPNHVQPAPFAEPPPAPVHTFGAGLEEPSADAEEPVAPEPVSEELPITFERPAPQHAPRTPDRRERHHREEREEPPSPPQVPARSEEPEPETAPAAARGRHAPAARTQSEEPTPVPEETPAEEEAAPEDAKAKGRRTRGRRRSSSSRKKTTKESAPEGEGADQSQDN